MIVTKTEIPDVLIIEPKLFGDQRGFFLETFQVERYQSHGIKGPFVQDNLSRSCARWYCAGCTCKTRIRRESWSR